MNSCKDAFISREKFMAPEDRLPPRSSRILKEDYPDWAEINFSKIYSRSLMCF